MSARVAMYSWRTSMPNECASIMRTIFYSRRDLFPREPGSGSYSLQRLWAVCGLNANRVFVPAFSVPSALNELISLKDDKRQRRMGYTPFVFRWSSSR